jgi:signal transduction histidine kinase
LTRGHEGTGLGLALVKSMMDLHDGSLEIESEPGKGTKVTIYFPKQRTLSPGKSESPARGSAIV